MLTNAFKVLTNALKVVTNGFCNRPNPVLFPPGSQRQGAAGVRRHHRRVPPEIFQDPFHRQLGQNGRLQRHPEHFRPIRRHRGKN